MAEFKSIVIFTDGACTGNPGPGGWAAIVARPEGTVQELGGGSDSTTNNRMELMGAIQALKYLNASKKNSSSGDTPLAPSVIIYTDSVYVIRGITQWIWGWRKRGWKNSEGEDVLNRDLWEELSRQVAALKPTPLEWKYVRGHTGVPGNERCDVIAVSFANGKWVDLFQGRLLKYEHAIYDLPPDEPLPEMKSYNKEKTAAFSYLSVVGGIVVRHPDWASCERRVKGQSGAKFKKAMSSSDEASILKTWGLDPAKTKITE